MGTRHQPTHGVENHRAAVMAKTGAKSISALARLAIAAEWEWQPLILIDHVSRNSPPPGDSISAGNLVASSN